MILMEILIVGMSMNMMRNLSLRAGGILSQVSKQRLLHLMGKLP